MATSALMVLLGRLKIGDREQIKDVLDDGFAHEGMGVMDIVGMYAVNPATQVPWKEDTRRQRHR